MDKDYIILSQYTSGQLYTLMYNAEHAGAHVGYIRGMFSQTLDDFFREVSASFRFPSYFGWNWAAFDECITDLEWLKFSQLLFVIENTNLLCIKEQKQDNCIAILKKHMKMVAKYWEEQGIQFTCYFNTIG